MFKSKFILFFIIAALPISLFANDTGVVRGRVVDAENGEGIPVANVMIRGTLLGAATDRDGYFEIHNLPNKPRIELIVQHIGYKAQTQKLELASVSQQLLEIELHRTALLLTDEVVVIAERANDAYLQTALRSNPDGGGRMLRDIPGLQAVSRSGVAYDPVIRGLKEEQINVTIDGIKIVPACNGRMDPATAYADFGELNALEISKGPFSTTGLGTALGGKINFEKSPVRFSDALAVHGSMGMSYNSTSRGDREFLRGEISNNRFDLQLSASRQNGENYQSAEGEVPFSAYFDRHLDAILGLRLAKNQSLRLAHYRSDGQNTGYPALPMDTRDHSARLYGLDYTADRAYFGMSSLHLKIYRSEIHHVMDNLDRPTAAMMEMVATGDTETTGGNFTAQWRFGRHSVQFGADIWDVFATSVRSSLKKNTGMRMSSLMWPDVTMTSAALYGEYQNLLSERWIASAGLRFNASRADAASPSPEFMDFHNISDTRASDSDVSGFVRLAYLPGTPWQASLSLGRGVRAPDHKERYSWYLINRLDGYDYIGDPRTQPETNWFVNLSLRHRSGTLELKVEPYVNFMQNSIFGEVLPDLTPKTPGAKGVKVYTNIGAARIYGLDIGFNWNVVRSISLFSNISYARGQDLDRSAPLPEMPPLSTLTGVRYLHPSNRFWVQVETRAAVRQDNISPYTGEDETPSFVIYNVHSNIRIGTGFNLQAGVENVSNVFYHEHLDRGNIPRAGRNAYMRAMLSF